MTDNIKRKNKMPSPALPPTSSDELFSALSAAEMQRYRVELREAFSREQIELTVEDFGEGAS